MTSGIYHFITNSNGEVVPQKRGDTFNGHSFGISVITPPSTTPVPVDFSGAVIKLQVRKAAGYPVVLEWTTANGSITVAGNIITMQPKTGAAMDIEAFKYVYDLQVLLSNGVTNTYVQGTFEIIDDISR